MAVQQRWNWHDGMAKTSVGYSWGQEAFTPPDLGHALLNLLILIFSNEGSETSQHDLQIFKFY